MYTANTRICIIFTTQSYSVVEINTSVYECILLFLDEPLLDYALPFQSQVPPDPTLEDMRELVVEKQAIPEIPEVWSNNEVIHHLMQF